MSIIEPSQYDCDTMHPGDLIYIQKRNFIYRLIRKYFLKDKKQLTVRTGWQEPVQYKKYYQEDCIYMYSWEVQCMQKYNNEVPCTISLDPKSIRFKPFILKSLSVGLYNIEITFKNNLTFTIPIHYIDRAIKKNEMLLESIRDERIIQDNLRYRKQNGDYFKNQVKERNIESWIPSYCSVCGNPVIFKFEEDKIVIDNTCDCNNLNIKLKEMNYDEFAVWYANQTNPSIKNKYKKFWLNKE